MSVTTTPVIRTLYSISITWPKQATISCHHRPQASEVHLLEGGGERRGGYQNPFVVTLFQTSMEAPKSPHKLGKEDIMSFDSCFGVWGLKYGIWDLDRRIGSLGLGGFEPGLEALQTSSFYRWFTGLYGDQMGSPDPPLKARQTNGSRGSAPRGEGLGLYCIAKTRLGFGAGTLKTWITTNTASSQSCCTGP